MNIERTAMGYLFRNEYGDFRIDPETGALVFDQPVFVGLDLAREPEPDDSLQVTEGGAEYSIFSDHEDEELLHIEIQPDFVWSRDDILELVDELLYRIGEVDELGNPVNNKIEQKPLYVIECPGSISDEQVKLLEATAFKILEKAKIDAIPVILTDGIKTYFDRVR